MNSPEMQSVQKLRGYFHLFPLATKINLSIEEEYKEKNQKI